MFLTSQATTALLVCAIHAAYKSGIFLVTGKLLSRANVYSDGLFTTTSDRTYLALIGLFLMALRTSSYASIKHQLDGATFSTVTDFSVQLLLALSLILV